MEDAVETGDKSLNAQLSIPPYTGERAGSLGVWGCRLRFTLCLLSLTSPLVLCQGFYTVPRTWSRCSVPSCPWSRDEELGRKKGYEAPSEPQWLLGLLRDQPTLWKLQPTVHFGPKKFHMACPMSGMPTSLSFLGIGTGRVTTYFLQPGPLGSHSEMCCKLDNF